MGIPFPSDIEDLNETDFDIIRCIYSSGALWKMEITRQVNQQRSDGKILIERSESITKQAVSRRVERLHELGYLESSIIHLRNSEVRKKPDRDFIEGYKMNDKAEENLEKITKLVLRDVISQSITSREKIPRAAVEEYFELYSSLTGKNVESLKEFVELET